MSGLGRDLSRIGLLIVVSGLAVAASPTPSPAAVTLTVGSGTVGTPLTVSGTGFPPNTPLAVYVDSPYPYVASPTRLNGGGPETDSSGKFSLGLKMPNASYGSHDVCADSGYPGSESPNAVKACAGFAVQPAISIDPSSGDIGTTAVLTGTGFPSGEVAALYVDSPGQFLSTPGPVVGSDGFFIQPFSWHTPGYGAHQVCGDTGYISGQSVVIKLCAQFMVTSFSPSISLGPTSGPAGTDVSIEGSGFAPSAFFVVTVDGQRVLCSPGPTNYRTDASGHLGAQLTIQLHMQDLQCPGLPLDLKYGDHTICVNTGAAAKSCGRFDLLAPPTPVAATTKPSVPLWVFASIVAVLIVIAAGATIVAVRATRSSGR